MNTAAPQHRPAGPRHIQLNLKRLDSGQVRVSTPQARGWATVARGPDQLWHALQAAFAQAGLAGQAAWAGQGYGHDERTDPDDPTEPAPRRQPAHTGPKHGISWSRDAAARPDVADPADWLPLPDGAWLSPAGKRYRAPRIVNPVIARRAALGLPITYEAAVARARELDESGDGEPEEAMRFWARMQTMEGEHVSRWHTGDKRNPARVAS